VGVLLPVLLAFLSSFRNNQPTDSESEPDDVALIAKIVEKDQNALAALYRQYGGLVYSLAYRMVGQAGLAEEVTQDTFMKVWKQAESWDARKGKLVSWLLTIARYTAIDYIRQVKRQPQQFEISHELVASDSDSKAPPSNPMWADGQLIQSLLGQLPPEQAQVIDLAFFKGMTHTELAETLQLPLGTVKTRLRLGLQKLKGLWLQASAEGE
jgi:RNA polymerase sigma-70 factor (ECF subfamily)